MRSLLGVLNKVAYFLSSNSKKQLFSILSVVILTFAVGLTVNFAQQHQTTQQHASSSDGGGGGGCNTYGTQVGGYTVYFDSKTKQSVGIAGVSIVVHDNCQNADKTVVTDANGYWSISSFISHESSYNIRPPVVNTNHNSCPQGFVCNSSSPITISSYDTSTPVQSYEHMVQGNSLTDCQVNCDFVYTQSSNGSGSTCGDGICNNGETCSTCPQDCGMCTSSGGKSYMECEYGNTDACNPNPQTGKSTTGNFTWVTANGDGTYQCTDQGYYDCTQSSYSPCQPDGLHKCVATLPGNPVPTGNQMYQATWGDSTACGSGAQSRGISQNALLYCVCGIDGAPACPSSAATPTPTATPTPNGPTDTPTPTQTPSSTKLTIALQLPGIGKKGNLSPKHTKRPVHISIYASNVDPTQPNIKPIFDSKTFFVRYNNANGYFTNTNVNVGSLPTGDYQLLVKVPGYLRKQYMDSSTDTKTIHLTQGQTNLIPVMQLIVGDVAPLYNVMDLSDFYAIVGCYENKATSSSCSAGSQITDLNDDGVVNGIDLNYWLIGYQTLLNNNDTNGNGDGTTGD